MGRIASGLILLGSVVLSSCTGTGSTDGTLGTTASPIAYGTADGTHTAVVSLLGSAGGGTFSECSGTIVQVRGGVGYVLTAAHCCNMTAPSIVVMSNDYTVGEQYLGRSTASPPAYVVTPGSVYYDSRYNNQDHDFCMLKFAAPSTAAVIPVPAPGADGLSFGATVEHVGFGTTDTSTSNSGRRTGSDAIDQNLTTSILGWSQGGPSRIPGTCEGDSGGPALFPAGAAQGSQMVVGVTSYGNGSTCSSITVGVASRVTSETGPTGFITEYLNDTPTGTQAGSTTTDPCTTCANNAQSTTCASQAQACANDQACLDLNTCLGNCTTSACATSCQNTAGTTAVNELNAFDTCICSTACTTECATQCGGTPPADGGTTDPCTTCANSAQTGACSTEANACANDQACLDLNTCLGNCTTNACFQSCATTAGSTAVNELNAFDNCICNTACPTQCATQCGGGQPDGGTSTDAGAGCGLSSGVPTCDACLQNNCCSESLACANDTSCTDCLVSNPPSTCGSNANLGALVTCLQNNCASQCGSAMDGGMTVNDGGVIVRDAGSGNQDGGTTTRDASSMPEGGTARNDGGTTGADGGTTGADGGTAGDGGTGMHNGGCACVVGAGGAGSTGKSNGALASMLFGLVVVIARRGRRRIASV